MTLDELGLTAAIDWLAEDLGKRTALKITSELSIDDRSLQTPAATALFRILQESLSNVTQHAAAERVRIELSQEDSQIVMEIRDDGVGIQNRDLHGASSVGLLGIRERAAKVGGEVTIGKHADGGTMVSVRIPTAHAEPIP